MDPGAAIAVFAIGLIPAAPGMLCNSMSGALAGLSLALVGAVVAVLVNPIFGGGIWLSGFILSWVIGAAARNNRRSERRHRELIKSLRQTPGTGP